MTATATRVGWLQARERKRTAIAWSSALGIYLLVFIVVALFSLFSVEELADYSGPIVVRLGSPEGSDIATPRPKPPEAQPAPVPVVAPEIPAVSAAPVIPANPAAAPSTATTTRTPAPGPALPAPAAQPAPPQAPPPVVLRGSENGNSYDMTYLSGSGIVGRSFYVPIWLFMPVPNEVPESIHSAIPDLPELPGTAETRKKLFATYYKNTGGTWLLKGFKQPDYDVRQTLWVMLEDAGYDLKNAEYKKDKHLKPVTVLFKVSAPGPEGKPRLEDVQIEHSSGYSNIDDDVMYGFNKAQFSNSGSTSISGRFTYRF